MTVDGLFGAGDTMGGTMPETEDRQQTGKKGSVCAALFFF